MDNYLKLMIHTNKSCAFSTKLFTLLAYLNNAQHYSYLVKNDDLDFVAIPLLITDIMAKYI